MLSSAVRVPPLVLFITYMLRFGECRFGQSKRWSNGNAVSKLGRVIELIDEGRLSPEKIAAEVACPKRYVDYVKRHINLHRNNAAKSSSVWSEPRIELLKRCWAEGMSASQTARRLGGFTHCEDGGRSAVIGKIHRLGLAGRQVRERKTVARSVRISRQSSRRPTSKFAHLLSHPMPTAAETDIARVSFYELDDRTHCKWPVKTSAEAGGLDKPMFCGDARIPGLPYCGAHCHRAFSQGALKQLNIPVPVEREKETA